MQHAPCPGMQSPHVARAAVRPLEEVLLYSNDGAIEDFLVRYDLEPEEAKALFRELLKFLWLGTRAPFPLSMYSSQFLMDELWHAFILRTREYSAFCDEYLGGFAHHDPPPESRRTRAWDAEHEGRVERTIGLVYDVLGKESAILWYGHHASRYTPGFLASHRREWPPPPSPRSIQNFPARRSS